MAERKTCHRGIDAEVVAACVSPWVAGVLDLLDFPLTKQDLTMRAAFQLSIPAAAAVALIVALMMLAPLPALADVTWTLQGVTFDDGGTASGTFVTDAVGYEAELPFNIQTTSGPDTPGYLYNLTTALVIEASTADMVIELNDGGPALILGFFQPLTIQNSPDAIVTNTSTGYDELNSTPSFEDTLTATRNVTGGEAIAAPEPMSLGILIVGLAGLSFSRLQRRRTARL